jgi:RNA polymerase sigma factor (sigma-70 family)
VDDPSARPGEPNRRGNTNPEGDKLAQRPDLAALLARARATARRAAAQAAPPPDRSDLAQSVVRELLRVADRLDYRGEAAFDALVRSIFVHKLRKKLARARAGKRDVRREVAAAGTEVGEAAVPVDRSPANDPVQMALAADLRARLQAQIEELGAREREVILLRASGLTAGEVAAKLGLTEANAQKIYTRTRAELEAALLDHETS